MEFLKRFVTQEDGAETVEYALVLGLMALAAVVAITQAGGNIGTWWNGLATRINNVGTG
jgi:pilus assembly protein Flp/PilA